MQQGMVRHLTLLGSALLSLVVSLATTASAETVEHRGVTFHVYRLDPATENLELRLAGKNKPGKFTEIAEQVRAEGKQLKFAMNSGIFEGNFLPSGLHIADGKTVTKLNTKDFVKQSEGEFTPNFYLKPNGVFYFYKDGKAGIRETGEYLKAGMPTPWVATQSGPLLVRNGTIHPVLGENSESERYRNGVGVTKDGEVIFACSVLDRDKGMSNLYRTAEMFRDKLGCPDVLYLDGDISYAYIDGVTPPLEDTNWFAGIFTITEK